MPGNLVEAYRRLSEREIDQQQLDDVFNFGMSILEVDIELLHGVSETLEELSIRHELVLFTKGNTDEQRSKIERSGIAQPFPPCRHRARKRCARLRRRHRHGWRDHGSHLDGRKFATLGYQPGAECRHGRGLTFRTTVTWELEIEEITQPTERFLQLERFPELTRHF